jgi:hypothetical protein
MPKAGRVSAAGGNLEALALSRAQAKSTTILSQVSHLQGPGTPPNENETVKKISDCARRNGYRGTLLLHERQTRIWVL